jgi:hypothetical protein
MKRLRANKIQGMLANIQFRSLLSSRLLSRNVKVKISLFFFFFFSGFTALLV